jgi:hypothetical protein
VTTRISVGPRREDESRVRPSLPKRAGHSRHHHYLVTEDQGSGRLAVAAEPRAQPSPQASNPTSIRTDEPLTFPPDPRVPMKLKPKSPTRMENAMRTTIGNPVDGT